MRSFRDAHSAAAFIESCDPYRIYKEGIIAFWATQERPPQEADAEFAVLVRTEPGSELVHPFAFTDDESATSYVRFRSDETGEPLESFILYWAAPIRINANPSGEVRLEPSSPPRIRQQPGETYREPRQTVLDELPSVVEPAPGPDETREIEQPAGMPPQQRRYDVVAEDEAPAASESTRAAESAPEPSVAAETRWSRRAAPRALGARVKAHALALGLLGYGGREIEHELRAMFPGDRVPSYATIARWLKRAGISRSNLKKWETMSEQAIEVLEKRLAELDGAPLSEVARVVALLESMRRQ